jgi:hypothetical protein
VQECIAVCAQICTETRKCSGDTFGDGHHLCRIRRRSAPDQTHDGLHGGASDRVRARRCGDVPSTLPPSYGCEETKEEKKRCAPVVAGGRAARRDRQQVREDGTRCARTEAGVREVRAGVAEHREAGERACKSRMRGGAGVGATLLSRSPAVVAAHEPL